MEDLLGASVIGLRLDSDDEFFEYSVRSLLRGLLDIKTTYLRMFAIHKLDGGLVRITFTADESNEHFVQDAKYAVSLREFHEPDERTPFWVYELTSCECVESD